MRVEPFHICIHCLWMFVVLVFALCQKVKTGWFHMDTKKKQGPIQESLQYATLLHNQTEPQ